MIAKNSSQSATSLPGYHPATPVAITQPLPGWWMSVALAVFFLLIIVLPNSIRPIKLLMFPGLAAYCFYRLGKIDSELLIVWGFMAVTTITYLVYPPQPKLTPALFVQISFVYMAAPLFWILICDFIVRNYDFETIRDFLFWCVVISFFSVLLYYYLFMNYGAEAVSIFIATDSANAKFDRTEGVYKATMHVFGSLIFLGPAFLASETLGLVKKIIIVILLLIVAFISGRDALIACMALGGLIYAFFRYLDIAKQKMSLTAIVILLVVIGACFTETGQGATEKITTKLQEFGGEERRLQYNALVQGIQRDWMTGAGHTASTSYVRDPERPWRYELLPLALIYRVGIVGFLCYLYPVIATFWRMFGLVRTGQETQVDIFMATGMLATVISTATNPYLSSFEFQWCLFFPYCYFRYRRASD